MTNCQARPTREGFKCPRCQASWDRDDTPPCTVATRAHDESLERSNRYVSALAPPVFPGAAKR